MVVVSPDWQNATLVAGVELHPGSRYGLRVTGPGRHSAGYTLPPGGGVLEIPLKLGLGLNRFTLSPIATAQDHLPATEQVMRVVGMYLAGR
jgi:hypothetical protein